MHVCAKGKEAERVGEEKFIVRKGYLTTCGHERPHWKLSADRVEVYPNVKATTYNAVVWFNPLDTNLNIPAMWIPYYCHPLDDDRPRVTLIPGKDKDWGYYLLTAWRYQLTPGQKGYFHLDYRENKDVAVGMLLPLGLTLKQLIIASVVLTMYFPCVATFAVLIKELGVKDYMVKSNTPISRIVDAVNSALAS